MDEPLAIEPERYELSEPARHHFDLDRRDFLRVLTAMGGGLLVVAALPDAAEARQESGRGFQGRGSTTGELASWLHIDAHGHVTVYTGKVEIGQNIRTSLAQAVGGELDVPLASMSLVMADTDLTPFDQGTFGSRTTPTMAPVLAKAAATASEMLIGQAAAAWHVDRAALHVAKGAVVGPGGRSMTYGEITRGRALTGVISAEPMPADRWTLRGTPAHKVNGPDIVTGRHAYPSDIQRPNLLIGRVIRPPSYGATPRAVDDSAVRSIPGVSVIRDGDFIGVVAPNERVAKAAESRMKVDWNTVANPQTSETVYAHLKATARSGGRGGAPREVGDVERARAGAARVLEASYRIPYIAHVPLEPRAAVAEWSNGKVTVWTGTQRPFGVRTEVAQAFHLTEDQVRVIVPDMGSGYGGKHTGEAAIEAARLAKGAGRPVKLVYTRAEEFMWGYFRPAGVIDVRAGVDAAGHLVLWEFDNYNSGGSALNAPYTIPNRREAFHSADSPLRQGSYRGLAATANHYVREMHMNAVARAVGTDAVEFRLAHLDDPRLRTVLTTAASKAGWPHSSRPGRTLGVACGVEKGGYVATVAEVSKADRSAGRPGATDGHQPFTVERLVVVFECGAIVNPDGLRNQVEGAVIQGLGGALFEAIQFGNGQILNGTMAQYRVPRFQDVPPIDVVLVDRKDLPSAGAGETPIVCVAPAIGSALATFGKVDTALPVALA
jgi:CO/xanthine dehydrogenase Mo-binding subunit